MTRLALRACAPAFAVSLLTLSLLAPRSASAWDRFSVAGDDGTNCSNATCHGDFRQNNYIGADGQNWGDLHDLHRNTMVTSDCNTCHISGNRIPTFTASSTGGNGLSALSCMGCHGREEDNVAANPSTPGMAGRGAGLRQHHTRAGVTACAGCHADAVLASYTPVGEDVLPDYYANPGTNHANMPIDPCNPAGSEDFAGDTTGLDNDGDGLRDGADGDCMPGICGNGVVEGSEDCDDSGESATCNLDCTTASCGDGTINGTAGETCDDSGESATCNADCTDVSCGDGITNTTAGETCDGDCPTTCDDADACTTDTLSGTAAACDVVCSSTAITACVGGDGCCAAGCTEADDSDCVASVCGDGTTEGVETCDGDCPTSCADPADACTSVSLQGDAATCDAVCAEAPVTACVDDDGCCPSGCDGSDTDCIIETDPGAEGCGCTASPGPGTGAALAGFLALGLAGIFRRRR